MKSNKKWNKNNKRNKDKEELNKTITRYNKKL